MTVELTCAVSLLSNTPVHYELVVDADLLHVGGGSALTDY